jgi:hypothetical protein
MGRKIAPNLLDAVPNDRMGRYVKWGLMGALGVYLYRLHRRHGSLANAPEGYKVSIDTDKMVDTVSRYVRINPQHAGLAKEVLREFRHGYKKGKGR